MLELVFVCLYEWSRYSYLEKMVEYGVRYGTHVQPKPPGVDEGITWSHDPARYHLEPWLSKVSPGAMTQQGITWSHGPARSQQGITFSHDPARYRLGSWPSKVSPRVMTQQGFTWSHDPARHHLESGPSKVIACTALRPWPSHTMLFIQTVGNWTNMSSESVV